MRFFNATVQCPIRSTSGFAQQQRHVKTNIRFIKKSPIYEKNSTQSNPIDIANINSLTHQMVLTFYDSLSMLGHNVLVHLLVNPSTIAAPLSHLASHNEYNLRMHNTFKTPFRMSA